MGESSSSGQSFVWFQQGDVTIRPVGRIPEGAERVDGHVLAEGEATGHAHRAEAAGVRLFIHERQLYMRVPTGGTRVVHEEHHAVDIPAGDYLVGRVMEYDHFAEEAHPVYD